MRPQSSISSVLALCIASGTAAVSNTAWAQQDQVDKGDVIENIIVTARRREETLQSVPVAVSAFNNTALQDLQAADLSGLQGAVPNLNLVQGRGSASSANVFIRGIGQPDALQTFDPGVGIYVDGVYISRIQGALLGLYDIERIEVLRGPQGTLYGKNTIGGAINLVSKRPDDQISIKANAAIGRFDHYSLGGYVGGPLVPGRVWASIAAAYEERDGIVTDPETGRKFNDRDNLSTRAILRAAPTERLELTLSGDYTRQRNELTLGRAEADLTQTDLLIALDPIFGVIPPRNPITTLVPTPTTKYDFTGRTSFGEEEGQELDHWGLSFHADWDASDWLTLASITAYRELQPDLFIDIDATEFEIGDVFVFIDQEQFSQELQAKVATERLNGVFGLYFLREKLTSDQAAFADDLFTFGGLPLDFLRTIGDDQVTKSYAAFTQWTYDLSERFSVTAGLRYTYEEKDYARTTTTTSDACAAVALCGAIFNASFNSTFAFEADEDWNAWTPSLTLDYQLTDETLIYASASRGFKSGGFNGRANNPGSTSAFDPETVWTLEAGTKNDLFDNRLRLNGAFFYNFYENFQARVGGETAGDFPVLNVAELETWGFELEAVAVPIEHLTLSGSLGYLNADYTRFADPIPNCDPTTCEPAFAPEWTLRGAVNYDIPIKTYGYLVLNGDVRHVSSHFLSVENRPNSLFEDGYTVLNAFVALQDIDRVWRLAFGVKNITDTVYRTDGQEFSNVGNIQTAYYGDPRTWQLSLTLDF